MTAAAHRHLARDPVMRRLIRRHGPYRLEPHGRSPYETLVRAIAHQQLNGRAAETILRSEEHTSELQSRLHLVCRLLLEKKKTTHTRRTMYIHYTRLSYSLT